MAELCCRAVGYLQSPHGAADRLPVVESGTLRQNALALMRLERCAAAGVYSVAAHRRTAFLGRMACVMTCWAAEGRRGQRAGRNRARDAAGARCDLRAMRT